MIRYCKLAALGFIHARDSIDRFNRKLMQVQVCCVRGGGGCAGVVTVTSIGLTTLLKNTQMANHLPPKKCAKWEIVLACALDADRIEAT